MSATTAHALAERPASTARRRLKALAFAPYWLAAFMIGLMVYGLRWALLSMGEALEAGAEAARVLFEGEGDE